MSVFKILHTPTGMFWQPHKHGGNTLSKNGKIYAKKHFAESALKTVNVQVSKSSIVYKQTKDILNYLDCRYAYNQVFHVGKQSDWIIIEI